MYKWKDGFHAPKGVTAETAASEFQAIRENGQALTAENVVDAARPKHAPLHPAFEWRNSVAAELYRQGQARKLMNCLVVLERPEEPERRAFLVVRPDNQEKQYMPFEIVYSDPDLFKDALKRLMANAQACLREAQALSNYAPSGKKRSANNVRSAAASLVEVVQGL